MRRIGAPRLNPNEPFPHSCKPYALLRSPPHPAMGSRLGRRVLHFANLPIKLMLPPAPLASVQEFAIKTVPSASKIDIRRCLESMYGFNIAEVRTLNMEGKKLRRGRVLAAKPDYKKAYVTLQAPLHVSPDIFPIGAILGERERKASAAAARRKAVEGAEIDGEREGKGKHWLEDEREGFSRAGCGKMYEKPGRLGKKRRGRARLNQDANKEGEKFPWNGMRLSTEKPARKKDDETAPTVDGDASDDEILINLVKKKARTTPQKPNTPAKKKTPVKIATAQEKARKKTPVKKAPSQEKARKKTPVRKPTAQQQTKKNSPVKDLV